MMNSLKDKVVLITGASRGIGFSAAQEFEKESVKLVLTAKENLSNLEVFKNAKIIKLNLTKKEDIDLLIIETLKAFGRIDILINNAAFFKQTDFEKISIDELDEMIDIDLKGPFLLLQKVMEQMKKQKSGKIINIASGAGIMGSSKASHYAACKAGLISLTKSIAKLGGPYNIKVNAIAPGFIETEMIKDILLKDKERIEAFIPLKRIGKAEDVSGLIKFLASGDSDYITGQTICVDGGHCMV